MDKKELKQLMKEAAREVFQEELKEILLEAIRSPKPVITETQQYSPINQQHNSGTKIVQSPVNTSLNPEFKQNLRESYKSILDQTAVSFNTSNIDIPFVPHASTDVVNGELPQGSVSMSQIMGLMGKK